MVSYRRTGDDAAKSCLDRSLRNAAERLAVRCGERTGSRCVLLHARGGLSRRGPFACVPDLSFVSRLRSLVGTVDLAGSLTPLGVLGVLLVVLGAYVIQMRRLSLIICGLTCVRW